jgi:ABC-type multidrug transport system fused ATPase/permease subunit
MLFLQIIIAVISSVPYCIQSIYDSLTQTMMKTEDRQAQENLILQIVRLAFYLNYISMFYVNYLSSRIFRNLSKKVLNNLFKKKEDISRDITIINHQQSKRRAFNISTIHTPFTTSRV